MSKFWEDVNQTIDDLLGIDRHGPNAGAFPSDPSPPLDPYAGALGALTPDQAQSLDVGQGYTPLTPNDPFQTDPATFLTIEAKGSSPFTVIDLTPSNDGGSRGYDPNHGSAAGPAQKGNGFQCNSQTLSQIAKMLATLGLETTAQNLMSQGAFPIGVTYPFILQGNSLRIERLSQGAIPTFGSSGTQLTAVASALVANDVRAQQVLGLFLNGLFIQFDSLNNPVFLGKPGENYKAPFTKVFVTTFGSAGRFRLIAGNASAAIEGFSDERLMRQSLHVWDGAGLLDNPMIHPVPFSYYSRQNILDVNTPTKSVPFEDATNGNLVLSNFDDGARLSQLANARVVGQVTNQGYLVFWITNISISLKTHGAAANQEITFQFRIGKTLAAPVTRTTFPAAIDIILDENFLLHGDELQKFSKSYPVPKRMVLAGFGTYKPTAAFPQATGESMFAAAAIDQSNTPTGTVFSEIEGYIWPALVPFCPYPIDPMGLPTN